MSGHDQAWAVVVAAGASRRMGEGGVPKPYRDLGGKPLLTRSLAAFEAVPEIAGVVLVVAAEWAAHAQATAVTPFQLQKVRRIVNGGPTRQASVAAGLAAVPDEAAWIIVHDGARPLVTPALIGRCLAQARVTGAAIAALPVSDTIKRVGPAGEVIGTLPREELYQAQTPQAFRADWLREAHARAAAAGIEGTDDASLVERLGKPVAIVPGDPVNFKITRPEDLLVAQATIGAAGGAELRVGVGFDVHRFVSGRPLVLGGVEIPSDRGLLGHSDADVLVHAIMDSLLGAAGRGDIGRHFPDSDPAYAGISSLRLLERVSALLAAERWEVRHVDAVLVAERPRIGPHVAAMTERIARALGVAAERINLKATTAEGLGAIGREEGIAAWATATLSRPGGAV